MQLRELSHAADIDDMHVSAHGHSDWLFLPLRSHRMISRKECVSGAIDTFLHAGNSRLWAIFSSTNEIAGFSRVSRCDHESDFFGREIYRIDFLRRSVSDSVDWRVVVREAVVFARRRFSAGHMIAAPDIDDYELVKALVAEGFSIGDVRRVYVARRHLGLRSVLKAIYRADSPESNEDSALIEIVRAAEFDSRFSRDPFYPKTGVKEFYAKWMSRLLSVADSNDAIVRVARSSTEVVAVGGIFRKPLPFYPGAPAFYADGLFAARPSSLASYHVVLDALIREGTSRQAFLETKVSSGNLPAIRILERLGFFSAGGDFSLFL